MKDVDLRKLKTIHAIPLLLGLLILPGCWDRKEVNDIAIVTAVGIDKKGEKTIELTVEFIIPRMVGGGQQGSGGSGGGKPFEVRSDTGVTLADAMSKLQEKIPRKLFWGHTEVVVIGEALAKEGILEHFDFFSRFVEPRLRSSVFVAKKASDIMKGVPPLELYTAEQLRELVNLGFGMMVTTKDLLQMLGGEAGAAVMPWVEPAPALIEEEIKEPLAVLRVNGIAVFKKDKMVGRMDDKVTRGVLWIRNEIKRAVITITPEEADGFISMDMLQAKTELIPKLEDGKLKILIKAETKDDLMQNATNLNVMNPDFIENLEKEAETDLKNRIRMALDQGQKKMNADIFGFAEAFYRNYPKEWEDMKDHWEDLFPQVEVSIEAKVKILRPGLSSVPGLPEKEVKKK
ncbi:Ger(x)C family spore germination protein [Ammoniphilus sp. YIM 78166]|uniref:Ger(x)C family spore germination protein n=1 Tax=Ammoniphilus sp. YIM 78166 TaxID=1644106 RepID=UPI00106F4E82|nr:Ger(x)C family spore germination protein [Ammoniphilus sp. YIM 78166]